MTATSEPRRAAFSERTLAFVVDAAPFAAGAALTARAAGLGLPPALHSKTAAIALLWGSLFLGYQAFFSSEGRVSLGKSFG